MILGSVVIGILSVAVSLYMWRVEVLDNRKRRGISSRGIHSYSRNGRSKNL